MWFAKRMAPVKLGKVENTMMGHSVRRELASLSAGLNLGKSFASFFRTSGAIISSPVRFFSGLPGGGYLAPLLFALIWGGFASVIGGFYNFWVIDYEPRTWLWSVLVAPLAVTVAAFASAALIHQFVKLWVGTGRADFEGTFRVWCYSLVGYILYIVPFVGPFVAPFYTIYLMVVGVREVHSGTTRNATWAVLVPFVIILVASALLGGTLSTIPI